MKNFNIISIFYIFLREIFKKSKAKGKTNFIFLMKKYNFLLFFTKFVLENRIINFGK